MKLKFIHPIHREGYIFVIIAVAFTFLIAAIIPTIGWISAIVAVFIAYFFRDPDRVTPQEDNIIVSTADGVVQKIEDAHAPEELEAGKKTYKRVSIFLNVFNVHVNRVPISGKITDLHYRSGKFFNASLEKASTDNERQTCVLETNSGEKIIFVQIAGLIAKRIICDLDLEQEVKTGEKFGIIRFGSRMDIYLPQNAKLKILEGQTVIGGETVIAEMAKKKEISQKKPVSKTKPNIKTKVSPKTKITKK